MLNHRRKNQCEDQVITCESMEIFRYTNCSSLKPHMLDGQHSGVPGRIGRDNDFDC